MTAYAEVTYAAGAYITTASSATFLANGNWTVPASIYPATATIELWGAGGSGAGTATNSEGGGGGAGGSYDQLNSTSVTPGASYALVIGGTTTGGSGNTNGSVGASTTFNGTVAVAVGGSPGVFDGAGGVGTTTGDVGDVQYARR